MSLMQAVLPYLIGLAMFATVAILAVGVVGFALNGKFYQKNARLTRAWNVLLGNPETREAESRISNQAFTMWADYFDETEPELSRADCHRISVMIFWSVASLLELSAADPTGMNRELVEETKILVKAYLGAVLPSKLSEGEPA